MKRIIPYLFIASYFFAFLIKEWNFKILAYDRLYPQILFLSGVNFLSLIYFYQKDHLKGLVDKTVKNKLVISYLIFLFFSLISIMFAENVPEGVIKFSFYLTFFFSFIFAYCFSLIIGKSFIKYLIVLFTASILIESLTVVISSINLKFFQNMAVERTLAIRGYAGNINITAFSICLKLPVLMYMLYNYKSKYEKYISLFALFFSFSALFILMSRGAFISMFVITGLFLIMKTKRRTIPRSISLFSIIIISSVLVQSTILDNNLISERVNSINIDRSDDSVNERLRYYSHAIESIKKNPFTGVGIGNWKLKSIDYDKQDIKSYVVPFHVHNDILQVGAEIGILGLLSYVFLLLYPLTITLKKIINRISDDYDIIVLLMIISYGIDSMLNFPISRAISHMNFIFILIFFIHIQTVINYRSNEVY